MGNYIEVGQFQSVRSRAGIKWSKTLRNKRKETNENSKIQSAQVETAQSQEMSKQAIEAILTKVKISIEEGIDHANTDTQIKCLDERNK